MNDSSALPSPDAQGLEISHALSQRIRERIDAAGGFIGFDTYMHLALYEPGLGYYAGGAHKFGRFAEDGSDFITAPELSPLFGQALAVQINEVCRVSAPQVMEFGAGSGRLAADLLNALGADCAQYTIVELSAELRARQQARIERDAPAHLAKVRWLDALPERFSGCIIGNEVLDAMPVRLIEREAAWLECGVTHGASASASGLEDSFEFARRPVDAATLARIESQFPPDMPPGYLTELHEQDPAFVATVIGMLEQGAAIFIDYGFPARELYHPQRTRGSLMCHVRHRAHDDPFWHPGLQDITAHVNFSAIAHAGVDAGAELAGYATQARFLMNCGLMELLAQTGAPGSVPYVQATSAALKLLSEAEMGELFKVIALTRGIDPMLIGFARGDRSREL